MALAMDFLRPPISSTHPATHHQLRAVPRRPLEKRRRSKMQPQSRAARRRIRRWRRNTSSLPATAATHSPPLLRSVCGIVVVLRSRLRRGPSSSSRCVSRPVVAQVVSTTDVLRKSTELFQKILSKQHVMHSFTIFLGKCSPSCKVSV